MLSAPKFLSKLIPEVRKLWSEFTTHRKIYEDGKHGLAVRKILYISIINLQNLMTFYADYV